MSTNHHLEQTVSYLAYKLNCGLLAEYTFQMSKLLQYDSCFCPVFSFVISVRPCQFLDIYSPATGTLLCTGVIGNSTIDHGNTGVSIGVPEATVVVCRVRTAVVYRSRTPGIIVISAEDAILSIPCHGNTDRAGDSRYSSILQCVSTDSTEEC